ncbi:hypothetical protein Tco_0800848 [Tanacetum coccineum]|uniref:Uncharacterized protein n=1 Tax=Tanacetum coccineum TaxID=301880 RepID=A0ABQ4ZY39_9ASTR
MTKVIKGEFEKLEDLKVKDVSLTCDTSLEVFNNEFNRLSGMDDDLFTYEVKVANFLCDSNKDDDSEQQMSHEADDDMGYDPSDIRRGNEFELTDEEFSDNEDEVAEVFRIDTNIFDFEAPMCKTFKEFNYLLQIDLDLLTKDIEGFKTYDEYKDDWIYEWNKDIPWVDGKPWTEAGVWIELKPVKHTCKPFNYKTGCSEWPTCCWREDEYYNRVIMEYLVKVSKRRAFWSLNEDILKITILKTNTPYPSRKIQRIRACTHQRPQRKEDQYAVSRRSQYTVLKI